MRVALVHEYFCNMGGAEVVARVLHEMFPDAPVYTLQLYDRNRGHPWLRGMELHTSFVQRLPFASRTHELFLPLLPYAIEQFDFSGYDLILSSSSFIAKGLIPPPGALHISYTQSRQRVAWDLADEYVHALPRLLQLPAQIYMHQLRVWDVAAAQRVDRFIANSRFVARRLEQLYRRTAQVIPPPVDLDLFAPLPETPREYYLVVGRLVHYKRFDLAVQACRQLGQPLHVIGDGLERAALEKLGGPLVKFLGNQPHAVVRQELAGARALLYPGLEDFGIALVEAQAMGCPVIAYGAGGALDSVRDGETGILFPEQTVAALVTAMGRAAAQVWNADAMHAHAQSFSTSNFKMRLSKFIQEACAQHEAKCA
jgi:glycosyltransferase involved in cell wall biosynthesis